MATEYKLSYTASEIDRKLATVDETKSTLENDYYTSIEVDNKFTEVNGKFTEVNNNVETLETSLSEINTSLTTKADLVDGKIVSEQLPDDIVNSSDLNDYYTKTEIDEVNEGFEGQLSTKADLVDGKIPAAQLPDDIGGGASSWNDLEDKPFGKTGYKFEWMLNDTQGKETHTVENIGTFFRISEKVISYDELLGATVKSDMEGICPDDSMIIAESNIVPLSIGNAVVCNYPILISISTPNEVDSSFGVVVSFPLEGTWILNMGVDGFVSIEKDYSFKKIDKEFLPDDIGGLTEVTWEDIKDKPFGKTGWEYAWDGDVSGKEELSVVETMKFYRISSDIPSEDDLFGATIKSYFSGNIIEGELTQDGEFTIVKTDAGNLLIVYGSVNNGMLPLAVVTNNVGDDSFSGTNFTVAATGIWFLHSTGEEEYTRCLQKGYGIKKIDKEYLPEDIGGASSWNDLTDKPFGDTGWIVEWDGNPTDECIDVSSTLGAICYKLDEPLNKDELIGSTIVMSGGHTVIISESNIVDINEDVFLIMDDGTPLAVISLNAGMVDLSMFAPGLTMEVPSAGLWFYLYNHGLRTCSITSSDFGIRQIDKKYIPDDIGGSNGVTSWNDLEDKPFYETGWSIEWDGVSTDEEPVDVSDTMGAIFYRVADAKTKEEVIGATCRFDLDNGVNWEPMEYTVAESDIIDIDEQNCFIVFYNGTLGMFFSVLTAGSYNFMGLDFNIPSAGVWFVKASNYTPTYLGKGTIKQIDKKFIPDDIVASVSLIFDEMPTEGSQNPVKSMGIHSAISALEGKITSTFCYKGTVDNYSDLPTDNTVGDVWNIANADETNGVNAGDNAAWNGTSWDILAGVIDLSDYYTKTEIDSMALNGNINLTNYYTKAETDSLIANAGAGGGGNVDLSDYYTKSETDSSLALKADLINGKVPLEQLPENIGNGGSIIDCPTYSGGTFLSTDPIMIFNYYKVMNTITADYQIDWNAGVYDINTNEFLFTFNSASNVTSNDNIVINIATGFNGTTYNDYTSDLSVELQDTKGLKKNAWYTVYCVYNETQGKMVGYLISASADVDTSALQTKANLVTSINENSTDEQYPSAKLLYDIVGDCNAILDEISALIGE